MNLKIKLSELETLIAKLNDQPISGIFCRKTSILESRITKLQNEVLEIVLK